jgi:IS1 family transposase
MGTPQETLSPEKAARVLASLVEGNSINSTVRMTGVAHTTILRLLARVGSACQRFHDAQVRYLGTTLVQCDEVWSFCYAKQRNVPVKFAGKAGYGSIWTWTALDAESKLLVSFLASDRSQEAADALIADLKSRTMMRLQITSDGYGSYIDAIAKAFPKHGEVDYAEEIKVYQTVPQPGMSPNSAASRYSPGRVKSVQHIPRIGMPFEKNISTSYMERWNLSLRMGNRRFTRLTNAFSKKIENHCHMLALWAVFYNFCRKHKSLGGQTPAMAAGLTDYRWTASDLLALDMWAESKAA